MYRSSRDVNPPGRVFLPTPVILKGISRVPDKGGVRRFKVIICVILGIRSKILNFFEKKIIYIMMNHYHF
jgi:hypothetical protein